MVKKLEERSFQELWQLFPIFLVAHNGEWKRWYCEEKEEILSLFPNDTVKGIYHIGSTAIPTIWAKNIIDILVEVENKNNMLFMKDILLQNSYLCMSEGKDRISLKKGYTQHGFAQKVFHLHIRLEGDKEEVCFRDYLKAHFEIAKEYELLKLELWKKFEYNRDGYTEAKSDFIKKYTKLAKEEKKKLFVQNG